MINILERKDIPENFLKALLNGSRKDASGLISNYLESGLQITEIYENVLKPSLYEVGRLWEFNQISVAEEHMASAVSEAIMNELYPMIASQIYLDRKAVISCIPNEQHQVGAKMVADVFELHGWNAKFLGANTPAFELLRFIGKEKPSVVGLSLSIYFNLPQLLEVIELVKANYPDILVFVGGQGFYHLGKKDLEDILKDVPIIPDLNELEIFINTL